MTTITTTKLYTLKCCCCLVSKLCLTFWDPVDCSSPGLSVHGISQQEYLSGLTFSPFPGDPANPGIKPMSPILAGRSSLVRHQGSSQLKVVQSRFHARYWMLGASALGRPRGMVWGGRREEGSGWGTHVYLWRIHFDIWQN